MSRRRVGVALAAALVLGWAAWSGRPRPSPAPAEPPAAAAPEAPVRVVPARAEPSDDDAAPAPAPAEVHCSVEGGAKNLLWGDLFEADPPLGPAATRRIGVHVEGGWLVFRPRHPENIGILTIRGYRDAKLAWIDGACTSPILLEPQRFTRLEVRVLLPDALKDAEVSVRTHDPDIPEQFQVGGVVDGRAELRERPGPAVLQVHVEAGEAHGVVHEEEIEVPAADVLPLELDLRHLPLPAWLDDPR